MPNVEVDATTIQKHKVLRERVAYEMFSQEHKALEEAFYIPTNVENHDLPILLHVKIGECN
jgi:hypothetical protein